MRPRATLTTLCALVALLACAPRGPEVRIGVKAFAEQRIVGEMIGALLRAHAGAAPRLVECGDTFGCQTALRDGRVDLMVEYTGTGLSYLGGATPPGADALAAVRARYEPLGLRWLAPLGFDNGYRLRVPAARAHDAGLATISDLASRPGGVRLACPPTFLDRPGDGLDPLTARYGLRLSAPPLTEADPTARHAAALLGRVDVVVGYATDGIADPDAWVELRDDLAFFPDYRAVVLGRDRWLDAHPAAAAALDALTGRLTVATQRALNADVELKGFRPAVVADRALVDLGLLQADQLRHARRPAIRVAAHVDDDLGAFAPAALERIRAAFPDNPARIIRTTDPLGSVHAGEARLALVGAERLVLSLIHI